MFKYQVCILLILSVSLGVFLEGQQTLAHKQNTYIPSKVQTQVVQDLLAKYGQGQQDRIFKGVAQVSVFWKKQDGKPEEFSQFCMENFIADPAELNRTFQKLSRYQEILGGLYNKMGLELQWNLQVDTGAIDKIDYLYGAYDPSAHLTEDLYQNKIAFFILLNFSYFSLQEKVELGPNWTREQWAYARIGDLFDSRVPANLIQKYSKQLVETDTYISEYNIYMGNLVDEAKKTYFPSDLSLISHWGLRDELKAQYALADGLVRQQMIYQVMQRIIHQTIPKAVINSDALLWNPVTNQVFQKDGTEIQTPAEPYTRYNHILAMYQALKKMDSSYPYYPSAIKRAFDLDMEIPVEEVAGVFEEFLASPTGKKVGELISKRLGRSLQPFDIWYDGFKPRSGISQEILDQKVSAKYATIADFEKDVPNILTQLGFSQKTAEHIATKLTVDPARGAGHAAGAEMRGFKAHLRTRVPKHGMDYKGFNIAMHELGHNVEQVMTLYDVDQYMLHGVPTTAFTEAWAFVFQARDLEILGMKPENPDYKALKALDSFWSTREIMGVALVDIKLWQWMYKHRPQKPEQVAEAATRIAIEVWNKYYADVFGIADSPILAIYSHMVAYPLYLSAYPVGHIIEFQLEKQMEGKVIGQEMERIYTYGRIIPQLWMKHAVGSPLSAQPMLEAAQEALTKMR